MASFIMKQMVGGKLNEMKGMKKLLKFQEYTKFSCVTDFGWNYNLGNN